MSSATKSRPVLKDETTKPAIVRAWRDVKWKIQPNTYNMRTLLMTAMRKAVDESEDSVGGWEASHREFRNDNSFVIVNEHDRIEAQGWLTDLFDEETYEKLFANEHFGNFVIIRATGIKDFEEMPIYARIGMHLLFYGPVQIRFLKWNFVRNLLKSQSIRQGTIYDQEGPDVVKRIADFIKTYEIDMSDVLVKDPKGYKTFNEFFSRKLKPGARKPAAPNDSSIIVSAADCRLNVFPNFTVARQFWVKGKKFTLPELLGSEVLARRFGNSPSLAIFRLAPQDYHRFHSPVTATIESITTLPGDYYTVNPQAVNQPLDVFTANRRDVCILNASLSNPTSAPNAPFQTLPVAFVAIGALLVGSVGWSFKVGEQVKKGDDLGWFQYGGSTVVCIFPEQANVTWDEDLTKASTGEWQGKEVPEIMAKIPPNAIIGTASATDTFGIEVLVRTGEKIGVCAPVFDAQSTSTPKRGQA
ncbi:hypothetical protein FRC14_003259 [Serendipita sp. 396]|nr:hypothetical protein FRC14_003259 [Serendipita sp. 396]